MVRKRWRTGLVLGLTGLACLGLTGCGAGTLYGLVDELVSGGNDSDPVMATYNLARMWRVQSYTGSETGPVTVPDEAGMVWIMTNDYTFTVSSDRPVSIGSATALLYDEAGTWRMVDARSGQLAFTLTRHAGVDIPVGSRREVTGVYTLHGQQLTLSTAAVGPGTVRYVMGR